MVVYYKTELSTEKKDQTYFSSNQKIPQTNKWNKEEDKLLLSLVNSFKHPKHKNKWSNISIYFRNRTNKQCYGRYRQINSAFRKGMWSLEEKNKLSELIEKYGTNWTKISSFIKRSSKQIRTHYLGCVIQGTFTSKEDEVIRNLYLSHGTKFSLMTKHLIGKSTEGIKQRFYSYVKKSLPTESKSLDCCQEIKKEALISFNLGESKNSGSSILNSHGMYNKTEIISKGN